MTEKFDIIVVGAGIQGLWTTLYLTRDRQKKVLLLEQFPLPHSRGGSHGQSRIIRRAYIQTHIAKMMDEAYTMWKELEMQTKKELFVRAGLVFTGDEHIVTSVEQAMSANNQKHTIMNDSELEKTFPQFHNFKRCGYVYEEDAGLLKPDKSIITLLEEIKKYGGVVRDEEEVLTVSPISSQNVIIGTRKQMFSTEKVIFTCGAWTTRFLGQLGIPSYLQPLKVTVCYWKDKTNGNTFHHTRMPILIDQTFTLPGSLHIRDSSGVYLIPEMEYPGHVKICMHKGLEADPDRRDVDHKSKEDIDYLCQYVAKHFPDAENRPSIVEHCQYTITPDDNYIIDAHPKHPNIIFGVSAGHGFKISPVFGKCLAQLALGEHVEHDISAFKVDRFGKPAASKL